MRRAVVNVVDPRARTPISPVHSRFPDLPLCSTPRYNGGQLVQGPTQLADEFDQPVLLSGISLIA